MPNNDPRVEAILKLPRRIEPLCGQNYSYVKLEEVIAALATTDAATYRKTMPLSFTYRNWKREVSSRECAPLRIWYGSTEWHPEPQWFLKAVDLEKNELRDFAIVDMTGVSAAHSSSWRPVDNETGVNTAIIRWHKIWNCPIAVTRLDRPVNGMEWLEITKSTMWPEEAFRPGFKYVSEFAPPPEESE